MSPKEKDHKGRLPSRHGFNAALAGIGWLAAGLCASAQITVDTIGGGVRVECGPVSGFVGGNTYDTAQFNTPVSCALDANGNLWIADKGNSDLEQVTEAGNKAGSATIEYANKGGNYHSFTNITGVAVDPANNLYVLLPSPPTVTKYGLTTGSSTINELSSLVLTGAPGGAIPSALVVDASSNVFLAFTNGVLVRFPLLDSNPPPTIYSASYTLGASAQVHYVVTGFGWRPAGLALRPDGQLAVSDSLNNAIWVVSTNDYTSNNGPQLLTGNNGVGFVDGIPSFAKFDQPAGLAASADGRLIVCDKLNNRLRVIDSSSNTTTLYGTASNVWPATCCTCDPTTYSGWVDGVPGTTSTNAAGRQPVSVAISSSNTLFVTEIYYDLIREVANVTFTPVIFSATLPVTTTSVATGLTSTGATFNGTVNAGGEAGSYYFQWGPLNNYTNYTATNLLTQTLTNTINVSATVSNLLPGTTYYFRLVGVNSLGNSVNTNYLTALTPAEPAVVTTLAATSITANSATLNASVNPEYSPTEVYFVWGATSNYANSTTPINLSSNLSATTNVSSTIGNLQAGTIYYFEVVAYNGGGSSFGGGLSVVTPAEAPAVATQPAGSVTSSNATLIGNVIPNDTTASYYFAWGLTTNYGNFTPTNLLVSTGTGPQSVSAMLGNLSPATSYHFQLVAFNNVGVGSGGDFTLTTPAQPAVVVTLPASAVTGASATLNANVDPNNSPTEVFFNWGTTSNYGNTTTPINLTASLTNNQAVSATIGNLQSGTLYYFQAVAYNSGGQATGSQLVFDTLYSPPPTLSFSPNSGYFPNCVTINVTSSVPSVYYTTNGSTPSTNSTEVPMSLSQGSYVGSFQWCNPQQSLSALTVLAGAGSNTTVLQGSYSVTNSVGFPQPLVAGSGSFVYIPVVIDLQSNVGLKSLAFRVEITPVEPNAPMIASINLQPLTPNDLVPLPGPAPLDAPVNFTPFPYTIATTEGLELVAEPGSGLNMQNSGVVAMLHLQIPTNAAYGQSYMLNVLEPSGTSDGQQAVVGLTTLPGQTLTISDPPYMVGDSSPSDGYNATQFGNGALDNADVNNAIYASAGVRLPPLDSDIYAAMDAYPPDNGDGQITFLDWQTILNRSLGLDTNNWIRFRTNGGVIVHQQVSWTPGGPAVALPAAGSPPSDSSPVTKLSLSNTPPGLVWLRQAAIGADTVTNVAPGSVCAMPVYVKILPGYSLSGLQFRAVISANGSAPTPGTIAFSPAASVPYPIDLPGLTSNDIVCAWALGDFSAALQNSNYLGAVTFQVPAAAQPGQSYALHFLGVDGAPNINTPYQLESMPGWVWVKSAALQPSSITSDEWKTAFFGSTTNSLAADNVDADGDGMPNWQEYLAGTNPTNALSRFQFASASFTSNGLSGIGLNWLTAPAKTYILESIPALGGTNWTAINTNVGDGNDYQFVQTNYSGHARFYQLRLHP